MTAIIVVGGSTVLGESIIVICVVTGLSSLASDTTITLSGPRTVTGTGSTSLQLPLNPALLSDAGQYTCMASVTSSFLNGAVGDTDTEDLRLQSELKVAIINVPTQKRLQSERGPKNASRPCSRFRLCRVVTIYCNITDGSYICTAT